MDPNRPFKLTPGQEAALLKALNSNTGPAIDTSLQTTSDNVKMVPGAFDDSPLQAPGSGTLNGFEESPFIDYDYEFDNDGSFDFDANNDSLQMIGNLPGTSSDGGDETSNDKRSHPDDDDEDEGGGKRREGDEKSSKKPGRKPLTSEPTSKRKAQNRAAQRAFRERKEKHLKDLETKVDDLQKASESANHENTILRAQIEKMSMELREYRKRISMAGANNRAPSFGSGLPPYLAGKGIGSMAVNNLNDVNFQFEFPKFGRLPGPGNSTSNNPTRSSTSPSLSSQQVPSPVDRQVSPRNQSYPNSTTKSGITQSPTQLDGGDMSGLSGLFSPSILESVGKSSPFEFFNMDSNASRSSADSANGTMSTGHNTSYSSPSASSNSNRGPSSSCGTSPEPASQSPGKTVDYLTTIGEESNGTGLPAGENTFCEKLNMACGNPNNPVPRTMSEPALNSGTTESSAFDVNGIDWFAQQNNNQFDPQLFGDYRESQDNVLSNGAFSDAFFQDAFALPDFNSPFNIAPSPAAPKKDLLQEIDERQNQDDEVVPGEDPAQMLSCNTIWDRLQSCPKVKEGEFDLDNLCKDLQKKAKCSETGAVVNEADFNKIMKGYMAENKGLKDKNARVTA
ncbi:bZIP transcription factor (ap-1) [Phlyctema vagabunda]|uniref:BZIP transcription factor (Ap-1) n=1 Tax=Phlyctema vagabunda TaxID=108571 RepID=A0ABR4PFI1_9HELO